MTTENVQASPEGCVMEVQRTIRDAQPAHYMLKIVSFSTLIEENIEKLESDTFEVGGHKWRLCLYPNGNKETDGSGHISLYLMIDDTNGFQYGWEIYVHFKLFVYNHLDDNYLTVQDAGVEPRRFRTLKTQLGFSQLLTLEEFNHKSNGYLFQDSCVFGAEILVFKNSGRVETISWIKEPSDKCFAWKVEKFSTITASIIYSDVFNIEDQTWKLELCPKGEHAKGGWLSVYLCLVNSSSNPPKHKFYTKYKLRIIDQFSDVHHDQEVKCWFTPTLNNWGFDKFLKLSDLKEPPNGFLVKDTLIIEVEFMVISVVKNLP